MIETCTCGKSFPGLVGLRQHLIAEARLAALLDPSLSDRVANDCTPDREHRRKADAPAEGSQVETKVVTVESIINHTAFNQGVVDKAMDEGFPDEYDTWSTVDQWHYERGRMFSQLFPMCQIYTSRGKAKPVVSSDAIRLFNTAWANAWIR